MDASPLDSDIMSSYRKSDVFHLLIVGMFIYTCGSSIAVIFSTFIRDVSLMLGALSLFTLALEKSSSHIVFIISVITLSNHVYKKVLAKDLNFVNFMWKLILGYFVLQFFSFSYTYWAYEMIGDEFFKNITEYYSDLKKNNFYTSYISYFSFLPYIFYPMILLFFGKKLNK